MSDMSSAIAAGFPQQSVPSAETRTPRIWPAVVIVILQWLALILPAQLWPGDFIGFYGFMVHVYGGALAILLWWLFGSRVGWRDVAVGLAALGACVASLFFLGDPSLRAMGGMPIIGFVLPTITTAVVASLALTPFLRWLEWRLFGLWTLVAVTGAFEMLQFDGTYGNFQPEWSRRFFRREPTYASQGAAPTQPIAATAADWTEFRGPNRDAVVRGVVIDTNWDANPPKQLWKHPIGKGWSSFSSAGGLLFTQEQRGDDELVVCYDAGTGAEVWKHADKALFKESIGGPGPRATPTFHDGKIYAQGATGILNCLDAKTGTVVWTRDILKTHNLALPIWGFAASPLVRDGVVTVYGGKIEDDPKDKKDNAVLAKDKAILAFKAVDGEPIWNSGTGDHSYCSTQLSKIDGVEQILIATNDGVTSVSPVTGQVLWAHSWPAEGGFARVTQPAVVGSDVLLGTFKTGTQRFHVDRAGANWTTKEVWTSRAFKPYYNDFVVHGDHAYGFDGTMFVCADLATGKRKWDARGYGSGQVLLLADQGALLILAETGEVALVEATPKEHVELARIAGINGKTWNHPTVVGDRLFIRNGQEAAGFQLKAVGK